MICLLAVTLLAPAAHFRVLLVGVDNYQLAHPSWAKLQGAEDAVKIKRVIQTFWGRDASISIHTLLDRRATKAAITNEITQWLFKNPRPDDKLFFFFSGHGTLVPAPELSTGVRSAILPIDARSTNQGIDPKSVISGEFFRNQLALLQKENVRNVTLVFDSCNSGAISRGGLVSKAVTNPAIDPRKSFSGDEVAASEAHVISAARIDRSAWQSDLGGNLTVSFARAVSNFYQSQHRSMTYGDLKDGIMANLATLPQPSVQEPAFLGDSSQVLFSDKSVGTRPYYLISSKGGTAKVATGKIFGTHVGAVFNVYKPNTESFEAKDFLGRAIVDEVGTLSSSIHLQFPIKAKTPLDGARALLLEDAPNANLTFAVTGATLSENSDLARSLGRDSHFRQANREEMADATFTAMGNAWRLTDSSGKLLDEIPNSESIDRFRGDLVRLARHNAVLELQSAGSKFVLEAEVVAVRIQNEIVDSFMPKPTPTASAELLQTQSFAVRLRARYRSGRTSGKSSVYVALLDCPPNNEVKPFWPSSAVAAEPTRILLDGSWKYLGRDGSLVSGKDLSALEAWHLDPSEGVGQEVIKVFATDVSGIEYAPLLSRTRAASGPQNSLTRILSAFRDGKPTPRGGIGTGDYAVTQLTLSLKKNPR